MGKEHPKKTSPRKRIRYYCLFKESDDDNNLVPAKQVSYKRHVPRKPGKHHQQYSKSEHPLPSDEESEDTVDSEDSEVELFGRSFTPQSKLLGKGSYSKVRTLVPAPEESFSALPELVVHAPCGNDIYFLEESLTKYTFSTKRNSSPENTHLFWWYREKDYRLVQEMVPGTRYDYLHPKTIAEYINLFYDAAVELKFYHDQNTVLCDMYFNNMISQGDLTVHIDGGFSRQVGEKLANAFSTTDKKTKEQNIINCPQIAPECWDEEALAEKPMDVFGLAQSMFDLCRLCVLGTITQKPRVEDFARLHEMKGVRRYYILHRGASVYDNTLYYVDFQCQVQPVFTTLGDIKKITPHFPQVGEQVFANRDILMDITQVTGFSFDDEIKQLMPLINDCIQIDPKKRPTIEQVIQRLQDLKVQAKPQAFFSRNSGREELLVSRTASPDNTSS